MAERPRRRFLGAVRRWFGRRSAASPPALPAPPTAAPEATAAEPRLGVLLDEWRDIRASQRHARALELAGLVAYIGVSAFAIDAYLRALRTADATGRWLWPAFELALSLLALGLAWGADAEREGLARRGRQIEMALEVLLPGLGRVKSLALLSDYLAHESEWLRNGRLPRYGFYGLMLLASAAALVAAGVGWGV